MEHRSKVFSTEEKVWMTTNHFTRYCQKLRIPAERGIRKVFNTNAIYQIVIVNINGEIFKKVLGHMKCENISQF